MVRRISALLLIVAAANAAVFAVEAALFTPLRVPTQSMWPSLQRHDRIAVNHQVAFSDLQRGDLVVFAVHSKSGEPVTPARDQEQKLIVKRVVALPGESVEARDGVVAVDQENRLGEPYLLGRRGDTQFPFERIRSGEVWVLGDNRDHSVDSREYGPVPAAAVVGRVAFRYWPLNRWHTY